MRSCNFLANWVANHITRSANDFCSLLLFIHPSSYCYCCYWYCYIVIELSCNHITRSANDFCSLLLFIHPSSCYCCYWYCYFVIEFKLLLLLLLILLFYYWIELQPHHKISKLLCQVVHSSNSYCIVIVIVENDNFSFGLEVEKMPMTIKQSGGEKNRLQTKSFSLPGFCPNSG